MMSKYVGAIAKEKTLKNRVVDFTGKTIVAAMLSAFAQSSFAFEEFFVPFPEDNTLNFLQGITRSTCPAGTDFQSRVGGVPNGATTFAPQDPINTITDFVVRVTGTIIVIDHFEDDPLTGAVEGYETVALSDIAADPSLRASVTTRIYGDGDVSNGAAPGVTTNADDVLVQGQVVVFEEEIITAGGAGNLGSQINDLEIAGRPITGGGIRAVDGVDGGDRIFATETINITRAQWATGSETLFAGAFELFPIAQWGTSFTVPVGENSGSFEFEWTGITVMAANDNTTVSIDVDGDDDFTNVDAGDVNGVIINRGETIEVAGLNDSVPGDTGVGLRQGARIVSSDIVQANIISGQECTGFASRWFTLFPDALLGNNYYEPVSTRAANPTTIYLYNPSSAAIEINWETTAGMQPVINVPARSSVSQIIPEGTGARFFTTTTATFGALTVTDQANGLVGGFADGITNDWGHASTSQRLMGNIVQVGYAEGDDPSTTTPTENGSPVWLIADNLKDPTDTEYQICVDVSGDGGANTDPNTGFQYDYTFELARLDSARLYDEDRDTPNGVSADVDGDQSGMLAFVCDGSDAILAAAWGQAPDTASGGAPGVDLGTTVRSVSADVAFIGDTVFEDVNGNGVRDPGEPGIEDITVILTPAPSVNLGNGPGQAVTAQTDFNGSYLFTGLVNGDYTVEVIAPSGFVQTFDPDVSNGDPLLLDSQAAPSIENSSGRLDQDFGYQNNVPQGRVGDFIYQDVNGDGIQDAGEPGIANIDVELCLISSSRIAGDEFSAVSYSNNPSEWASDWIEANDNNSPVGGEIFIDGTELRLNDDDGAAVNLTREFSSLGTDSVDISYDFRANDGAYEANDIISVQTSINGAAFVTQDTLVGTAIDGTSGTRSFSVTTGFAGNVRLRFLIAQYRGGDEFVFIDDIEITASPSCQTQTTDSAGAYLFENRLAGAYEVTVLNPPAGQPNTDDPGGDGDNVNTFSLNNNGGNLEQDFGYFIPATLVGHVYLDTNGNGVQEPGEPNVADLDVFITDSNGNLQTVTTDSNGDYSAEVPPGNTQVNIDDNDPQFPSNFIQTDGVDPNSVTAVAGITVDAGDDGYFRGNTIGDTVYSEQDGTPGVQGAGDPGIANVLVTLTPPSTVDLGLGNGVAISQFTDASGNYSFVGLPDANYVVSVAQPSGSTQTEDPDGGNDNSSTVSISGGTINNDQDFGYSNDVPGGQIGDRIYNDANGNGLQDAGELGLAGIQVQLCGDLDNDDATVNTCRVEVTDGQGDYLFGDLLTPDGATADPTDIAVPVSNGSEVYTVTVLNPPAGQINSADPDNGLPNFSQLALSSAGGNLDQDFGYFEPATITGHLYIDTNGNGSQDTGEPDLAGVDVVITDSSGNQQTVVSDINGDYIASVPPGSTTANVDETDAQFPINHAQTEGDDPSTINAVAGVSTSIGIDGYAPMGFIGDKIFFDNSVAGTIGQFDLLFDSGIPSVVVTLTPPGGVDLGAGAGIAITTLTDANGDYGFGSLPAGTYTVQVTPPGSVSQTVDPNEAGLCSVCDSVSTIVISAGETNDQQDFGYQSIVPPGVCPVGSVNFDEYPLVTATSTTIIDSEYATAGADNSASPLLVDLGFTVTAVGGENVATLYNSTPGTGGQDPDLELSNSGNVLIVQETGNPLTGTGDGNYIPDDQGGGSSLFFDFETPLTEFSLTIIDFETTTSSLVFTDTTTGVSVEVTNQDLISTGGAGLIQNSANCPATPADEAICIMDNSITAAELAAFGGVVLDRFDRVEKRFTGSGGVDNVNFTYDCVTGSIGDKIFTDTNANGIFDAGDVGLPGIDVQICGDLDDDDATVETCRVETTDADGDYLFGDGFAADGVTIDANDVGLPPTTGTEDYTITVLNPPVGSTNTADPDGLTPNVAQLTLPGAFSNLDQDFGYVIRSSLSGTVWLDEDLDGILDIEETGITGTQVELVLDGVVVATTVTDANGDYSFPDILPGDYIVNVVDATLPPGLQNTAGTKGIDPRPISVLPGETVEEIDFGYIPNTNTGAIGDRVWSDANSDGIQDPGEAGIAGVVLTLLGSDGNPVPGVSTVTTNENGDYLFTDVPFGDDYIVSISPSDPELSGFTPTVGPQSEGSYVGNPVTINATASVVTDIDFGFNAANTNTIIDAFWFDSDRDGIRDTDEQPIAGVSVTLFNDANNDGIADDADNNGQPDVVASTVSDANGQVFFTGLPDGNYVIGVTDVDNRLHNYLGTTGEAAASLSDTVSVAGGQTDTQESFGYNQPGLISGTVYADTDSNSDQNDGEAGISGTTVTLLLDSNGDGSYDTTVDTVLTGPDGSYEFNVNNGGEYRVVVTPPGGTQTEDPEGSVNNQGDISLANGESSVGNNFGYTGLAGVFNLSGTVFIDPDKDGVEDAGEPGIEGVTLDLIDRNLLSAYDLLNGQVDINNDGRITAADDGVVNGIAIVDGGFDIDGNGVVNQSDLGDVGGLDILDGRVNLAEAGTASQSSNFNGSLLADTANDGIPDGGLYAHTTGDNPNEWWQVDLGSVQSIGDIKIFNRDSCCQDRLAGVSVLISDTPFPVGGSDAANYAAAQSVANAEITLPNVLTGDPVVDFAGVTGRYVRLQKTGTNIGVGNSNIINFQELLVNASRVPATSDGVVASITTDSAGNYSFTGLANGDYSVAVTDSAIRLAGFDITSGLDVLDRTINNADEVDVDFGYIREESTASISGEVFIDENDNGEAQDEEFNLSNVDVHLCRAPLDTGVSLPNGVVSFARYTGAFSSTTEIDTLGTLDLSAGTTASAFDFVGSDAGGDNYGYIYQGFINITTAGNYRFRTTSDDGTVVFIDGVEVVNNDGLHGNVTVTSDEIALTADFHSIEVRFFERTGGATFVVQFEESGAGFSTIPAAALSSFTDMCNPSHPNFVESTRTDVNGEYIFRDLPPGQYVVDSDPEDIELGLNKTVDPVTVNLSEGENVTEVDHGYRPTPIPGDPDGNNAGVLSGFVWVDVDANGVFDANEAPIEGVTINVFRANGSVSSGPVLTTTTGPDGSWLISNIVANLADDLFVTYQANDDTVGGQPVEGIDSAAGVNLNETQPTNLPFGDNLYNPVPLLSDEDNNIGDLNFGFDPGTTNLGSIRGSIYTDADQDGDLGASTPGNPSVDTELRDVTVNLLDAAGNVIATTRTDSNGEYMFIGLDVGDAVTGVDYQVVITDNINVTRDLNPLEVLPILINLRDVAGTSTDPLAGVRNVEQQDAGFISDTDLLSIGNRFFFDANRDGIADDNESGIEGITIQCWLDVDQNQTPDDASIASSAVVPEPGIDNLIRTVQTDENGEYVCTSLPAGQYIVVVADSNGFDEATDGTLVTGNAGDNFAKNWSYALTLGTTTPNFSADFGVSGNNSISGTIFVEAENLEEPADGNTTIQAGDLDGVAGGPSPDSTVAGAPADDIAASQNVPVDLLLEQADGSFQVIQTVVSGADGSYTFDGLPDGRYQVRVRPSGTGIDAYGQTGDPDLAAGASNPTDLVCDSATAALCDNTAATPIDLDSSSVSAAAIDVAGIDFGYQRGFATTPVTMNFFSATRSGSTVSFVWETSNEVGHAGFQVYARGDDGWELLNEELLVGNIDVSSDIETKLYTFEATTDAKWFALVDVSDAEEVIARGPFEVGQEYGATLGESESFDWSSLELGSEQTLDDIRNSVNSKLDTQPIEREERDPEFEAFLNELDQEDGE